MDVVVAALAGCAVGALVALLVAERRLRAGRLAAAAIRALSLGAVIVDRADRLLAENPAARGMGLLRGDALALSDLRELAGAARRGTGPQEAEVRLLHGWLPREPLAVRARAVPIDGHGHVALFVEDVTGQRRVADMRRDFVANVSHELKTPIGAISLLAEALHEAGDDPESVSRFSARLLHESNRLGRLLQALIDLSRLEAPDVLSASDLVPVAQLVAEAVDRTRTAAAAHDISVRTPSEPGGVVRGHHQQLVTALVNLLDNAIRYSPPGRQVEVEVTQLAGPSIEICVADEGVGIPEEDLDRVFERFYRADPARSRATGGNGLGLAIVKHVVANHHGQVRVASRLGQGSRFTVALPEASATGAEATHARRAR